MNLAKILKLLRKKYKLTQKELANIVGVSHQTISLIERTNYEPSIKVMNSFIKNFPLEFSSKKYTKEDFNEFEREIMETYELLREQNNPYTTIASFRRILIKLNQEISETAIVLNTLQGNNNFKDAIPKIKRPIRTTINYLETITNQLKEIINNEYIEIEDGDKNGFK